MKILTTALLAAAVIASAAACGSPQPSPAACKAALTTAMDQVMAGSKATPNVDACKGLSTAETRKLVGEVIGAKLPAMLAKAFAQAFGSSFASSFASVSASPAASPASYADRVRALLADMPGMAGQSDSDLNGLRDSICGAESRGATVAQVEHVLDKPGGGFSAAEAKILVGQADC